MRFLYCACCISYILKDWTGVDKDLATKYIKESMVRQTIKIEVKYSRMEQVKFVEYSL